MTRLSANLLRVLRAMNAGPADDHALGALAARAGRSPFHVHRAFRSLVGETPKQYSCRVRLDRAAAVLATGRDSILAVALAAGFDSHEVFTRAFRRRFGCTPTWYRRKALAGASASERARHLETVMRAAPCIGLFHLSLDPLTRRLTMPTSTVERRDLTAEPILFVRRKVSRAEIPAAIGECLGAVFAHAQKNGLALAGQPFTRYPSAGPGLLTVEIGFRVVKPGAGEGEIEAGFLAGGPAAFAVHKGPYEQLGETYAALERYMTAEGVGPGGAPWEVYVTDPGETPDPVDWLTEVYWPIAS